MFQGSMFESTYTRSSAPVQHFALAASLLLLIAVPLLGQSGPTTVRRDVHHDVSQPLSEMVRHAPPPSLVRRQVEPLKRIPLPPGLTPLAEDPAASVSHTVRALLQRGSPRAIA